MIGSVVSVGYEGRGVEDLLASLQRHQVDVMVDVRLTPLSRKPGLSKTALAATLGTHGIRYLHLRALGNPKDNRALLRSGDRSSRDRFTALLRTGEGAQALRDVAELLQTQTVALLCFERHHEQCHRQLIVDELRRAIPALHLVTVTRHRSALAVSACAVYMRRPPVDHACWRHLFEQLPHTRPVQRDRPDQLGTR